MAKRELYFISGSPPCWTVMLALEMKGVTYEPRRLDNAKREQKSSEYLAINHRGQVPTLVDGDVTVSETLAILSYLDASHPSPPLFGATAAQTGLIWQIICEVDGNLRDAVGDISRPLFRGNSAEFVEQITKASVTARAELELLEERLGSGPCLVCDNASAADLIAFPLVMQLTRALTREEAVALDLGVYPLDDVFPKLAAWTGRLAEIPGFENAYPPHWK